MNASDAGENYDRRSTNLINKRLYVINPKSGMFFLSLLVIEPTLYQVYPASVK